MSIQSRYLELIADRKMVKDGAQLEIVRHFDLLRLEIEQAQENKIQCAQAQPATKATLFLQGFGNKVSQFLPKKSKPITTLDESIQGVYVWGAVGRGKTFLMDLFFDALSAPKIRLHYYAFMQRVHQDIKSYPDEQDPLFKVASGFAQKYRVIFLDEFFVSDITDAMILYRLMFALFQQNVYLVTTSNVVPEQLFKNGLQRERFLPAIKLMQEKMQILSLDTPQDYRLRHLTQAELWVYEPKQLLARQQLLAIFDRYVQTLQEDYSLISAHCSEDSSEKSNIKIEVNQRTLLAMAKSEKAVMFDFIDLCGQATGAHDYLVLCENYDVIFLNNIPILDVYLENEARRFISLIDTLYDQGCKFVASAAAEILDIYQGERLQFEFERTQSRLIEMQSDEYWQA